MQEPRGNVLTKSGGIYIQCPITLEMPELAFRPQELPLDNDTLLQAHLSESLQKELEYRDHMVETMWFRGKVRPPVNGPQRIVKWLYESVRPIILLRAKSLEG